MARLRLKARRWLIAGLAAALVAGGAIAAVTTWPLRYEPLYDEVLAIGDADDVAVADPAVALTFARTKENHVYLVTGYREGAIYGVDLTLALGRPGSDPLEMLAAEGYERLAETAQAQQDAVPVDQLRTPVDLGQDHIAAGLNYPEHAGEVSVDDGPFLFPKLVEPTSWNSPLRVGQALLDYEVEVAWIPLDTTDPRGVDGPVGMILANDFTDRATLLDLVDTDDVAGGAGFTTAKSAPGYLPVGNLLVVPRDPTRFGQDLELRLYVNGELRQRGALHDMIWDLPTIVDQTLHRRSLTWTHRDARVSLLDGTDHIPPRTLMLSGTPQGTVYTDVDLPRRVEGFLRWAAFGWNRSIPDHAINAYVGDARSAGIYLQPGDRVTIVVDYLGVIDTPIE